MTSRISIAFVAVLATGFSASAQRRTEFSSTTTKIFDERLNSSYESGEDGFVRYFATRFVYPLKARTNGVMGLSVFAFKVDCNNRPYALQFKTKLGFGIEDEIERVITKTKGEWLPCSERDTLGFINFKIAFTLNDLYESPDAFLTMSANGDFPGVSDVTLINDLRLAREKNDSEGARAALTKLVMRFPYDMDYRKKLMELSKKQ